jgi:hypothetical protein
MHYVLMIHAAEARFGSMSKEALDAMGAAYGTYTKELDGTGRSGDRAALEGSHTATSVQVRNGKRIVKDGPFAETREQLGGYYTLDAASEEEALDWASKIPGAKDGSIEVRPIVVRNEASGARSAAEKATAAGKDYLFLIYQNEAVWTAMTEAERTAAVGAYMELLNQLRASGQYVGGGRLDGVAKAKTVTVSDKRVVKDGPFAETREQLGGYFRVRARDLDEAIAIACKMPAVESGTIEIRPVWYSIPLP